MSNICHLFLHWEVLYRAANWLSVSLPKWIIPHTLFTENRYFKQYNQKFQFWHLFVWQGYRKLLSYHFKHHPQFRVGSRRTGGLEGLAIYSREPFHFIWFCFKGTPLKWAALPEFTRKHTLESICVFGRVRFIWCQAILTRRSELKELTLPTEGLALWGQAIAPRLWLHRSLASHWNKLPGTPDCPQLGNMLLSMNLMQITLNSVRQKTRIYTGKKASPTVGYTAKLWQGNELNPYLLTVLGHKENSLYFCIAHGNFLFISSIAAC